MREFDWNTYEQELKPAVDPGIQALRDGWLNPTVAEAAAAGLGVFPSGKTYTAAEVAARTGASVEDLEYAVYDKGTVEMFELLVNDPWFQALTKEGS